MILVMLIALLYQMVITVPAAKAYGAQFGPTYIFVDGVEPIFVNDPIIKSGTTMVEFRPIFEVLGLTVNWDPKNKKVIGKKEGITVEMIIGSKTAYVNGEEVTLNIAPYVKNGRTLIPLRFVAEASGKKVKWDGKTRMILINDGLPSNKLNFEFTETNITSQLKEDALQGKLGPFHVGEIGKTLAEIVNRYGFPDARHDGTPSSDDIPFIVYGDYFLYYMGTYYDDELDYLRQTRITSLNVSLPEGTVNGDMLNVLGNPDAIEDGMFLTLDYYLGNHILSVETSGYQYSSYAYAMSISLFK